MNAHQETRFKLGEVTVSPSHNTLLAHDKCQKLQPKVMAVLHYLALNQHRVISNEELIEHLWEGRVVTHGSVQKSINALRSAWSELAGDQELIAHYSKRGYQLKIEPQFLNPISTKPSTNEPSTQTPGSPPLNRSSWKAVAGSLLVLVLIVAGYWGFNWNNLYLPSNHLAEFHDMLGYTNETGHERNATPHPDNQHLAYIREKLALNVTDESDSDIMIRNPEGKDWRIAGSNGAWFTMAWSPAGNSLVAIEAKRRAGSALGSRFYEPPNYLYSFHIFTLDIAHQQLLEKQQLSQWQGRIFSVTWWDEFTLEIVAKQGPNAGNRRYRYSIKDQQLKLLDEIENAANPIASAVLKQKTAIASVVKNRVQIDFLNTQQKLISRAQLNVAAGDISWIPDGSGVLVYAEEERKLLAVYLNGKQVAIPLVDSKDKTFSHPHYKADGQGIFYTEEKRRSNILLNGLDGNKTLLTENTDFNYAASFSADGGKIAYASVRNNQINLWLIDAGQEHQLTRQPVPQKVDTIIWSRDAAHIVFNAGNQLHHHNILTGETNLILEDSDKIEPLAYFPANNQTLLIKHNGEVRNLWRIQGTQQKQLTFGAVGSAIEFEGDVYFQYVSEDGLWVWRHQSDKLEQINASIDEYSKLLDIDSTGIYYMNGGACNESDIYYWNYADAKKSVFLPQPNGAVLTSSFNPNKGLLQTECNLPEANIVLMK